MILFGIAEANAFRRAELANAKMEAEQAKGHIEQFKAIAQANEDSLGEMNKTYDEYKKSMDEQIAEKETAMTNLEERITVYTTQLETSTNENSELHGQLEAARVTLATERQQTADRLSQVTYLEAEVASIRETAKHDVEVQSQRASEAHERYEKELVAHAENIKALSNVKRMLTDAQQALSQAESKANTANSNLENAQSSWNTQKQGLQDELNEQKKR